jgi:outer membrane usher protein FimD/PapC
MNTVRSGPATSSSLNKAWLSITGKDTWKPTDATVFSCDWTDLPDQIDGSVGHYHVVYSYQVDGTFYTGQFADYGMQDEEYFKRNDVFQVRYNPRKPTQSYYPGLRTRHNFVLICCAVGAVAAVVVLTIAYLTGHLHS